MSSKASEWIRAYVFGRRMEPSQPQTLMSEAIVEHLNGRNHPAFYAPMYLYGEEKKRLIAWVDSDGDLAPGPRFTMTTEFIAMRPKYALEFARWILDTFGETEP